MTASHEGADQSMQMNCLVLQLCTMLPVPLQGGLLSGCHVASQGLQLLQLSFAGLAQSFNKLVAGLLSTNMRL